MDPVFLLRAVCPGTGAALVIPEVQRSFYIDGAYGLNYFTYVSQELPAACHRMFGLSLEREKNYVMGLSMGGFGALKCALTYPERYAGCGSFSGVTDLKAFMSRQAVPMAGREFTALLGPVPPGLLCSFLRKSGSGAGLSNSDPIGNDDEIAFMQLVPLPS